MPERLANNHDEAEAHQRDSGDLINATQETAQPAKGKGKSDPARVRYRAKGHLYGYVDNHQDQDRCQ